MDFYIKQRIFSLRDQFTVFDAEKSPIYKVDGKFFSIGNQLAITTTEGTPVLQIKQQVMSFMPRYAIANEEKELCVVAKKMSFFRARYQIEPLNWSIEGSLFDHHYAVKDGNNEIMSVEKQWLSWGDTYHLHVQDPKHETISIALMIVLDMVHHQNKNSN
ncbi:LURP-one-related family protein [Shouchella sp. 1P09AA]|uniref:LURP-one-related/scramblase family protein n=1 Tax=unclassified Shouchella TaxID=2893065 RepID=UPI0039A2779F